MRIGFALVLCIIAGAAAAQATYRWVDKDGKVHYTGLPPSPSDAVKVEQRKSQMLGADKQMPYLLQKAVAEYPVTLFTSADCGDPCRQGKELLARRGIPFTERSVASSQDIEALRAARGDQQTGVPVLQVGTQVAKGYLGSDWENLLDAAGYPKVQAKTPADER